MDLLTTLPSAIQAAVQGPQAPVEWPSFGDYTTAQSVAAPPPYYDTLVAVTILLVAVSVLLYHGLLKPRGRGRTLLLLTAPPRTIPRVGELAPSPAYYLVGHLQSFLIVGLLAVLLLPETATMSGGGFWLRVGEIALIVGGCYLIWTLLQAWVVHTFCQSEGIPLWWADYRLFWIIAVNLFLLIALLLRLFTPISGAATLVIVGVIYLVYRVMLLYRELQIFSHLRRYPLHIILYLCACEIGPVLFVLDGVILV